MKVARVWRTASYCHIRDVLTAPKGAGPMSRRIDPADVGRPVADLSTPVLLLDKAALERNIGRMADAMRQCGTALRPHVKAHKSPEIARLQMRAGAVGICAATVWEAAVMARFGIQDILVANQVIGWEKIDTLMTIARRACVTVVVDSAANVRDLACAAARHGLKLDVLVEVDVGMGRAGARSPRDAVELANEVELQPSLQFRGVQGYEGHCMVEADSVKREAMVRRAHAELSRAVQALEQAGHACSTVSAGGTGTCYLTGRNRLVTELQAGSYALMDSLHHSLVPDFELAMTVLATVQSRHGPRVIVDAGNKSIRPVGSSPPILGYDYPAVRFDEEHALIDVDQACELTVGDNVQLIPGDGALTSCLWGAYHVVEGDQVVDVWPILPCGPGRTGFEACAV